MSLGVLGFCITFIEFNKNRFISKFKVHAHQICWCYLCLIFFGRRKIDNSMDFTNRKRKKYHHFIQGKARDWKSRGKCVFNRSFIRFSSLFATSFLFERLKLFYSTIENTCTNTYIQPIQFTWTLCLIHRTNPLRKQKYLFAINAT